MGEINFTIPKSQLRKVAKANSKEGEAVIELQAGYFTEDNQAVITAKTEKEAIRILRASRKEKVEKEPKAVEA